MPDLPPPARNALAHSALLRLVAWVQEQGGSSARVYFRVDAEGQRELCAAGPLPAGALLLHIPRHLLITLFSDEALAPLQGSYVLPAILRRRARLDDEYRRIAQHLPPE
ncbi:MAG: hypothetical protein F9K35_16920, partial [Burkholderiaceae bacterium]